jgi:subtilisin family serine protease
VNANRREFLLKSVASFAAVAGSKDGWAVGQECGFGDTDTIGAKSLVRVSLHPPGGFHYTGGADVRLRRLGLPWVVMSRRPGEFVYESEIDGGIYRLQIKTPEYEAIVKDVEIGKRIEALPIYLGKEGWPSFWFGGHRIPFEPRNELVTVVFMRSRPSVHQIMFCVQQARRLGLKPFFVDPTDETSWIAMRGAALVFRTNVLTESVFSEELNNPPVNDICLQLQNALGAGVRVGIPVETKSGRFRVLDRQYVIKFKKKTEATEAEAIVKNAGAEILASLSFGASTFQIRFGDANNYLRHLGVIDQWIKAGDLVYGEPDLIFEMVDHVCIQRTNDPWSGCQADLARHQVRDAWCFIENSVSSNVKFGSKKVVVATLDRGVHLPAQSELRHPDINISGLVYCLDFYPQYAGLYQCEVKPLDGHGMMVYGAISATTNNRFGISGIAPSCSHVVINRPEATSSALYGDTLQWLAGLPDAGSSADFPSHATIPIPASADIINCSHDAECLPMSHAICDAARRVVTLGGNERKGTIIVCAAGQAGGNDDLDLQGLGMLGGSQYTIAVGNTSVSNGLEERFASRIGFPLDLCANAHQAPELLLDRQADFPDCEHLPRDLPSSGVSRMGGTSTAAAMVSAAVALILTVDARLNWKEVLQILRQSSDKIDLGRTNEGQWLRRNSSAPGQWEVPFEGASPVRGTDWFSKWYGYGRLNIFHAVKIAHGFRRGIF